MMLLDELIEMFIGMNDEQLRKVKNIIFTRQNIQGSDPECEIQVYHCPKCNTIHIIKFGKKKGKQRYFCKECHKVFMPTIKTIAYKGVFPALFEECK